jgi:hypothetical protein
VGARPVISAAVLAPSHRLIHWESVVAAESRYTPHHILPRRVNKGLRFDFVVHRDLPMACGWLPGASETGSGGGGSCIERWSIALKLAAIFGGAPAGPPCGWFG